MAYSAPMILSLAIKVICTIQLRQTFIQCSSVYPLFFNLSISHATLLLCLLSMQILFVRALLHRNTMKLPPPPYHSYHHALQFLTPLLSFHRLHKRICSYIAYSHKSTVAAPLRNAKTRIRKKARQFKNRLCSSEIQHE